MGDVQMVNYKPELKKKTEHNYILVTIMKL